ncbi:MAG TPA: branched-chain amino acid aminotransferase [Syntrophales bacterium]|nr:branched-chain amino acid aminotransferase [Syntrophales bacterium]HPQ42998.1 branched-chain amino acid aminotransferase [Syntrophales bacterium]
MEITVTKADPVHMKPKPEDESKLGFGKIFTDHFFTVEYDSGTGWHDASIEPIHPLTLDPAAMCLHYGQEIFEGMKAYRGKDDSIYLFRPEENIKRMNRSAERLCMPTIDSDLFMEGLKKLVLLEKDWIPHGEGTSLYIRPTMIATEAALGVHAANRYLFFIILCPVGAYYPQGFSPTKIFVSEQYVRAAQGGVGYCKAGGNYAAGLYASREAEEVGCAQVLWLDARERKYVEEVGTSNIFFVIGDDLITPPLAGSILPGVTRESVIRMARSWGVNVLEKHLSMDEIMSSIADGTLKEAFASGTAAIVSPVGTIYYRGEDHAINNGTTGPLTERLYNEILQIQYGEKDDPFGWRLKIA